jgi:hypothetical protein
VRGARARTSTRQMAGSDRAGEQSGADADAQAVKEGAPHGEGQDAERGSRADKVRAACCVLRAACCVLRAACCVLRAACCVLRAACCVLCLRARG